MLELISFQLEEGIMKEVNRLDRLRTNIFLIKNGGIPQMNEITITIKKVEAILAASIRKKIPSSQFNESLETMWDDVNKHISIKREKKYTLYDVIPHRLR